MVGSGIQDEPAEGLVFSDIKAKMNIPFKSPPGAPAWKWVNISSKVSLAMLNCFSDSSGWVEVYGPARSVG